MDPFTEKLLERTRARRENLQKKMAERPAAANRQMTKRTREPLAETNSMLSEPVIDEALHPSTKPSPSKRRCSSEENAQPPAARGKSEENREPGPGDVPALQDPPTDRKPPAGPGRVRSAASLEQKAVATAQVATAQAATAQVTVQPIPEQTKAEEMVTSSAPPPLAPPRKEAEDGEGPKEAPTPAASGGMRSRLQRLAEQRHYWDNDASDDAPPSPVKRLPEAAPPVVAPAASTEPPVGRKGRLANLAATIGCWEDDLSRPTSRAYGEQAQPAAAAGVGRMTCRQAASPAPKQSAAMANSKPLPSSAQSAQSPFKSSKVAAPSPQKADVPAGRLGGMSPAASPQKSSNKAGPNPAVPPTPQSPLKNQVPSRCLDLNASPSKLGLPAKPATSGPTSVPLGREKLAAKEPSTPQQQKATGTPVVKSFLERFGEKCQERANQSTSTAGGAQLKNPRVTPSVTPNTKLVQERLRAAQAASTTTADLTQRQKLERETELAQIRSRFQKGNNVWKNKEEVADDKEPSTEYEVAKSQPKVVLAEAGPDTPRTPSIFTSAAGIGLAGTPPNSTSSPLRMVNRPVAPVEGPFDDETPPDETSSEEVVREIEMNVDASINSAVINELFECVLEQSDDTPSSANHREDEEDEDDDEEDALNISSMSLLTPLAATVASVVKSPERRMLMTSTPAGSFIEKRETPNSGASTPSKFQRARVTRTGSSDSVESLDEDHKLPYSVDAYRSIRVKETERPHVKQVIVRKEDVSLRTPEPRGPGAHVGIKQRMKDLTNEMNLQQMVIHQASQALNCCTDEEHGKGSPVEAEAERLLLVATEKRAALKAELDRMKGEGPKKPPAGPSRAPKDMGVPASKGSITLQELRLPLKADFVCATANKPDSGSHYFFLMIRAGAEHTVATPLASTRSALSGDALSFTTKFTMSDVSNDFEVDIQVYSLVLKRALSHDKKKKAVKSKTIWRHVHEAHDLCMSAMTPKRFLAITKSNHTPVMASPGGPNAVRTSNFVLVGSHRLTLASVGKNKFPLEKIKYEGRERELLSDMFHKKVPFLCPLEGHIYLKMQCQVGSSVVEERGFLTMFEDVSGFGAWHRRWCVLSGYCISYWTYPDDERRKSPIGRINLANCTSRRVEPANREFCARPNTMELITVRPRREDDRETLVSQCQNTMCVTKNWLSADTKDERNLWMQKLNQILVDLRMWQPDSCLTPP